MHLHFHCTISFNFENKNNSYFILHRENIYNFTKFLLISKKSFLRFRLNENCKNYILKISRFLYTIIIKVEIVSVKMYDLNEYLFRQKQSLLSKAFSTFMI